jgi:hypothetical protein
MSTASVSMSRSTRLASTRAGRGVGVGVAVAPAVALGVGVGVGVAAGVAVVGGGVVAADELVGAEGGGAPVEHPATTSAAPANVVPHLISRLYVCVRRLPAAGHPTRPGPRRARRRGHHRVRPGHAAGRARRPGRKSEGLASFRMARRRFGGSGALGLRLLRAQRRDRPRNQACRLTSSQPTRSLACHRQRGFFVGRPAHEHRRNIHPGNLAKGPGPTHRSG